MAHNRRSRPMRVQTLIALGFLLFILLIAALLCLPAASAAGQWTSPLDALFTATSAVCVTGLVVVDTGTHWSLFGKAVILIAIQVGGLGVMTVLMFLSLIKNHRLGLRQRTLLQESVGGLSLSGVVLLLRRALIVTFSCELIGALLLSFAFVPMLGPVRGALFALFHAVSAFCNAGFDLMGSVSVPFTSLESLAGDPLVNLTVAALILIGGLGFFVFSDLIDCRLRPKRFSLHTRLCLVLAALLVAVPSAMFFLLEADASMANLPLRERILASLFSAVTPRTAGFDTVPTSALSPGGKLLTMMLMLVGGNPGSTAGGVKTTTLFIALLLAAGTLRREEEIHVLGRRVGDHAVRRACAIVFVYLTLIVLAALVICAAQPELPFVDVLLEVFSAINTVGMSTGVTRSLHALSRLTLIVLMYAGRLGSLTFVLLLTKGSERTVRHPVGEILVG